MDLRPVLHVIGLLLLLLALGMAAPLLHDFATGNPDWKSFLICLGVTAFFGGLLILISSDGRRRITPREGFLTIALGWPMLCFFASLPFWLGSLHLSFTDAFFEATSGVTTTGATVLTGLDDLPRGMLLWRALLQWLGGLGMMVMALALLPGLKIGGMQLFQALVPDLGKALPRVIDLSAAMAVIYTVLTLVCLLCYHFAGMSMFDALAHALTTLSTGGFSTHDQALGYFTSSGPQIVATFFTIVGALPFLLYVRMTRGEGAALIRSAQVRWFFGLLAAATLLAAGWLMLRQKLNFGPALANGLYHVTAAMTGTGYAIGDNTLWPDFPAAFFFLLLCLGACAGSTVSGIKIFRFRILLGEIHVQLKKVLHPHGVFMSCYNHKPVPDDLPAALTGFLFLGVLSFVALSTALSFAGLDMTASLIDAGTALANASPSSLPGVSASVAGLGDGAKWLMAAGMLFGRTEMLPLLLLLIPSFWRR